MTEHKMTESFLIKNLLWVVEKIERNWLPFLLWIISFGTWIIGAYSPSLIGMSGHSTEATKQLVAAVSTLCTISLSVTFYYFNENKRRTLRNAQHRRVVRLLMQLQDELSDFYAALPGFTKENISWQAVTRVPYHSAPPPQLSVRSLKDQLLRENTLETGCKFVFDIASNIERVENCFTRWVTCWENFSSACVESFESKIIEAINNEDPGHCGPITTNLQSQMNKVILETVNLRLSCFKAVRSTLSELQRLSLYEKNDEELKQFIVVETRFLENIYKEDAPGPIYFQQQKFVLEVRSFAEMARMKKMAEEIIREDESAA